MILLIIMENPSKMHDAQFLRLDDGERLSTIAKISYREQTASDLNFSLRLPSGYLIRDPAILLSNWLVVFPIPWFLF